MFGATGRMSSGWQVVGQGRHLTDLRLLVANRQLPKGTRFRIEMELPNSTLARAFDLPGAESIFRPLVPPGAVLRDVWGEGTRAIVEMESDPLPLAAIGAFIAANWVAIMVGGVLLAAAVLSVKLLIKVERTLEDWAPLILIGGGLYLLTQRQR